MSEVQATALVAVTRLSADVTAATLELAHGGVADGTPFNIYFDASGGLVYWFGGDSTVYRVKLQSLTDAVFEVRKGLADVP